MWRITFSLFGEPFMQTIEVSERIDLIDIARNGLFLKLKPNSEHLREGERYSYAGYYGVDATHWVPPSQLEFGERMDS